MITIGIVGAAGRMGKRLIALAGERDCRVVSALESQDCPLLGRDGGDVAGIGSIGVPISSALKAQPDVIIDFSTPAATRRWLGICCEKRIAMLIGTTGLGDSDHAAVDAAAADIAILQSPNMSLGIAVLLRLVRQAARLMGDQCDIEIVEAHHRGKKDAPSGTALALRDVIGKKDIPTHSLRLGDEIGLHSVMLAAQRERLELTHVATNRDTFAHGALSAATWLSRQKPGRYAMADTLNLDVEA